MVTSVHSWCCTLQNHHPQSFSPLPEQNSVPWSNVSPSLPPAAPSNIYSPWARLLKALHVLGIIHYLFFCVWFISLSILFSGHRSLLNSLPNVQIPHETQEAEEYSCAVSSFVKNLCIFTVLCLNWYSQTIGSYFFSFYCLVSHFYMED